MSFAAEHIANVMKMYGGQQYENFIRAQFTLFGRYELRSSPNYSFDVLGTVVGEKLPVVKQRPNINCGVGMIVKIVGHVAVHGGIIDAAVAGEQFSGCFVEKPPL
jgi:hypothetical protein